MITIVKLRGTETQGYLTGLSNALGGPCVEVFFPTGLPNDPAPAVFRVRTTDLETANFLAEMPNEDQAVYVNLHIPDGGFPILDLAAATAVPEAQTRRRVRPATTPAPEVPIPDPPAEVELEAQPEDDREYNRIHELIAEHIQRVARRRAMALEDFLVQVLQPLCNELQRPLVVVPQGAVENLQQAILDRLEALGQQPEAPTPPERFATEVVGTRPDITVRLLDENDNYLGEMPAGDFDLDFGGGRITLEFPDEEPVVVLQDIALPPPLRERPQNVELPAGRGFALDDFEPDLQEVAEPEPELPELPDALGWAIIRKEGSEMHGMRCFWQEPPIPGRSRPHPLYTVQVVLPLDHRLAGNGPIIRRYFEPDLEMLPVPQIAALRAAGMLQPHLD